MKTVYGLKMAWNELDVCVKEGNARRQLKPLGIYADNFSKSPLELAYAILAEIFDNEKADQFHQKFTREVLSRRFNNGGSELFRITEEEIADWIRSIEAPPEAVTGSAGVELPGDLVSGFLNKIAVQARINRIAHGDSPRPVMEWAVIAGTHMGHLLEAAMKGDGDALEKEILHVAASLLELYVEAVKAGVTE